MLILRILISFRLLLPHRCWPNSCQLLRHHLLPVRSMLSPWTLHTNLLLPPPCMLHSNFLALPPCMLGTNLLVVARVLAGLPPHPHNCSSRLSHSLLSALAPTLHRQRWTVNRPAVRMCIQRTLIPVPCTDNLVRTWMPPDHSVLCTSTSRVSFPGMGSAVVVVSVVATSDHPVAIETTGRGKLGASTAADVRIPVTPATGTAVRAAVPCPDSLAVSGTGSRIGGCPLGRTSPTTNCGGRPTIGHQSTGTTVKVHTQTMRSAPPTAGCTTGAAQTCTTHPPNSIPSTQSWPHPGAEGGGEDVTAESGEGQHGDALTHAGLQHQLQH
uniref:Uncharacterized protein n=1 Tax=Lygus hesperus TaxID=30085 RepID=A0A146L0L4_LYGHE